MCDAEVVLQVAREKIQLFQSGFSYLEEAEKDTKDVEEVETYEDYDCDDVEDLDADDIDGTVNSRKVIFCLKEGKFIQAPGILEKEKHKKMDRCSIVSMSPIVDSMPKFKYLVFLESVVHEKQEDFKYTFSIDGDVTKGII